MADEYNNDTLIALLRKDIEYISRNVCDIKNTLKEAARDAEKNFVSKTEFKPVKLIAYGLVGIAGTSIITWILYINLGISVVTK
jgi:hypothetical protein